MDEGPAGTAQPHAARRTTRYPAAISVGSNPTFDDVTRRQVEAYVLDETDLDLYGRLVEVQFATRVRGMVAFDGIDALDRADARRRGEGAHAPRVSPHQP